MLTSEEGKHQQSDVPVPWDFLVVAVHDLPVWVRLGLCPRLLERLYDVRAPEQDSVRDEATNLSNAN